MKDDNIKMYFSGVFILVLFVAILLMATCPQSFAQTLIPCGTTYTAKAKGEKIKCVLSTPAPTPIPTPFPTPVPTNSPPTTGNKTVCAIGCNYATVQEAVSAANPGDVIHVKNGTYTGSVSISRSGTQDAPITLAAYPGHAPILNPGATSSSAKRIEVNAQWWIIEGFDITNGWQGLMIRKGNNVIRNNYINDNYYDGIIVQNNIEPLLNLTIEGNIIEKNGIASGQCVYNGVSSPRHCHAIYFSAHNFCKRIKDIKILNNTLRYQGGAGVNFNDTACPDYIDFAVIKNNTFLNTAFGISMFIGVRYAHIEGNSFTVNALPNTNESKPTFLYIVESHDNTIKNNSFLSTNTVLWPLRVDDSTSVNNAVDFNVWTVNSNNWKWSGLNRTDFKTSYKNISGWDKNGNVQ